MSMLRNPFEKMLGKKTDKKETPKREVSKETSEVVDSVFDETYKEYKQSQEKTGDETKNEGSEIKEKAEIEPDLVKEEVNKETEELDGVFSKYSKIPPKLKQGLVMALAGSSFYLAAGSFSKAEAGDYRNPSFGNVMENAAKGAVGGIIGATGAKVAGMIFGNPQEEMREREMKINEGMQTRMMQQQSAMMRMQQAEMQLQRDWQMLQDQRRQALNNINQARNPEELKFAQDKLKAVEAAMAEQEKRMTGK